MDKEFIKKTIEYWQQYSHGKELRTDEGITIIKNTTAFFDLLNEWEKEVSTNNHHKEEK